MKLLTFVDQKRLKLGVHTERGIIDVEAALQAVPAGGPIETDPMRLIAQGIEPLRSYLATLPVAGGEAYVREEASIEWGPCVPEPRKIICVGLNYRRHAEETNMPIPACPILFNKFHNTVTAHKRDIAIPKVTRELDYEAELGIVIGKRCKAVDKKEALDYVFGYCNVNDLSARDLQMRTPQWMLGKIGDDFSPLGPYLVSADEVGDPNRLEIKTTVNGAVRQHSNTSDMVFGCSELVSYISDYLTLEPGDIILTGTPEGVVLGAPEAERVYLQPGDVVTIEIEKLGALTNRFVAEQG